MRRAEYFRWWVTAPGRKRPYLTTFPMTADEAQERYPGARPETATREVREIPDTDEERLHAMTWYQSAGRDSVQPPRNNPTMAPNRPTRPGPYRYQDPIGGPAQVIEVREAGGALMALFRGIEGDHEEAEIPVSDMAGDFEGPLA